MDDRKVSIYLADNKIIDDLKKDNEKLLNRIRRKDEAIRKLKSKIRTLKSSIKELKKEEEDWRFSY